MSHVRVEGRLGAPAGTSSLMLACSLAITLGCSNLITTEYVYTRQEPAVGRSSPTVFTVRLSLDPENRTVKWLEDIHDDEGYIGRVWDSWTDCNFFDRRTWNCRRDLERIEMEDGVLLHLYFMERRTYRARYKVVGEVTDMTLLRLDLGSLFDMGR